MSKEENVTKAVYSVRELQTLLGMGKNQTYELVKSGQFPVRKIGSNYLIPKESFDKWIRSGNNNSTIVYNKTSALVEEPLNKHRGKSTSPDEEPFVVGWAAFDRHKKEK